MPEQLWFTRFLNDHFGGMVTAMLRGLHIEPSFPAAPITNAFAMELLVFLLLIIFFLVVEPEGLNRLWRNIRNYFRVWPFSY